MVSLFFTLPLSVPPSAECDKNEQLPSGQANRSYMKICIIKWMCVCVRVWLPCCVCLCVLCTLVCAATEGYIGAYKHKISCCLPQKVQKRTKRKKKQQRKLHKKTSQTSQLFLHTVISSTSQSQILWQEMNVINAASNDANYSIWMWVWVWVHASTTECFLCHFSWAEFKFSWPSFQFVGGTKLLLCNVLIILNIFIILFNILNWFIIIFFIVFIIIIII